MYEGTRNWIANTNDKYGGLSFKFINTGLANGSFQPSNGNIKVEVCPASPGKEFGGVTGLESTLLHEITHGAQNSTPDIRALEIGFFNARASGKITNIGTNEGRGACYVDKDDFANPYSGRNYTDRSSTEGVAKEISTTGVEGLLNPAATGVDLHTSEQTFKGDTDYQNMMTGMILLSGNRGSTAS